MIQIEIMVIFIYKINQNKLLLIKQLILNKLKE